MRVLYLFLISVFLVCVYAQRGRIVGGDDAEIENYPYQISLQLKGQHFCGGSIYKPNVIITAAHCVVGREAKDLNIRAGSKNRESGGVVIKVKEIISAEEWNEQTIDNDIAIIVLAENLQYSNKIQPIELAKEEPKAGKLAKISGWGLLKEGGRESPLILKAITIAIWDRNDCNILVGERLTKNMICAGIKEGGQGPCQMDSGGPVVVDGKLVGVVSWAIGCARPNMPSVFANVPRYIGWISSKLS
ncbi:trypsin Blo t 3-like [Condylostylus longicornis]|uniref:trypsin Blo t 3-like n=1 Tax=Condylostylus longicornis TaxID=2530218 RepID=UPI00244E4F89|nr:trypsin Blo t 3-like [Condylostylus longicornis]